MYFHRKKDSVLLRYALSAALLIAVSAAPPVIAILASAYAASGDYEYLIREVKPNVLIILDTSNSMDEDVDGAAVGSDAANSRSEIARNAILNLINSNATKMRFGLMAYTQNNVQRYELHNAFYYCSYDSSTYDPAGTPTPKDPGSNTSRFPNPVDPGHYIYYDQALPYYSTGNDGNGYCYSYDFTEDGDSLNDHYRYFSSKTGEMDPPSGISNIGSPGLADYGYSSYQGTYRFVPTDEDYAAGFSEFGEQMSWVHVGPTWFSNSSPGTGTLHVPIEDSTSSHLTVLQEKLGTSNFSTNPDDHPNNDLDTPLRNAGLTPLAGALESARLYFQGTLPALLGGGQPTPIQYWCQKNFVVLVTDGLPSVDKNGNPGDADSLLPGVEAEVTQLRSTTVDGFSDSFDVQTFVVGFALSPELGSKLDDIAVAGGTDVDGHAYLAHDAADLADTLENIFLEILSRGASYVAPVVSVDESNRTQSGDDVYMAFFKPIDGNYWQGNLKKYGLEYRERTDCGRSDPEWTIVDQNWDIAEDSTTCDGHFNPLSDSYWSTDDGGSVDIGGVGGVLKDAIDGASLGDYDFRHIYTFKDGSLVRFNATNISNADLSVAQDSDRFKVINFMYGFTYDENSGLPVARRNWILGDIIHSEPRIIDYMDGSGTLAARLIAVTANDGMLHVFSDSDGSELYAFIPSDLLPRLQDFADPSSHLQMLDGSVSLLRSLTFDDKNDNGSRDDGEYYSKTLVFGERRGGRNYWALDVTDPDPTQWTVKWHIQGGTGGTSGFEELGYTWSKPFFARIRTASDTVKDVVIFSGGYDLLEDGFPEAFDDVDQDGIRDVSETFTDTENPVGTPVNPGVFDISNPGMDNYGRGLFVVDLSDGQLLFKVTYGASDDTKGIVQTSSHMTYCFPADPTVIPLSENRLLIYTADVYGQIWKITYDFTADGYDYTDETNSTKWQVKRIFQANPGSDLASGDTNIAGAAINSADAARKTFYSPDVSYYGNCWTARPVLYFGTGDRAHPRYAMVSNRFYVVADHDSLTDETDLLNLTCNELDDDADADHDGDVDADDTTRREELKAVLANESECAGFFRVLDDQGNCNQESIDHTGEQMLSQATLFFQNVFFSSYQPVFNDPCNPMGTAFIYALNYCWGISVFNYNTSNDSGGDENRDITDTYQKIEQTAIPSGVRILTRGGYAAGLISAGGSVSGVGEDLSTTIPGPPGGVSRMIWETQ